MLVSTARVRERPPRPEAPLTRIRLWATRVLSRCHGSPLGPLQPKQRHRCGADDPEREVQASGGNSASCGVQSCFRRVYAMADGGLLSGCNCLPPGPRNTYNFLVVYPSAFKSTSNDAVGVLSVKSFSSGLIAAATPLSVVYLTAYSSECGSGIRRSKERGEAKLNRKGSYVYPAINSTETPRAWIRVQIPGYKSLTPPQSGYLSSYLISSGGQI